MDFDKPKVYGDTFISDGLVLFKLPYTAVKCTPINIVKVRTLLYLGSMGFRAKCWTVWTGLDWSGYPLNCYDY